MLIFWQVFLHIWWNFIQLSGHTFSELQTKKFYSIGPGVDLIKINWHNFTRNFNRLDHFVNVNKNVTLNWKDVALKKEGVNLQQKSFYEICPGFYWSSFLAYLSVVLTGLYTFSHFIKFPSTKYDKRFFVIINKAF